MDGQNHLKRALLGIQARLDTYELKDINDMGETGLNYHMLADHSLSSGNWKVASNEKNGSQQLYV